jgi:pSer/pThr/pTyr-binding forkhead associated (FHA) protein
MHDGRTRKVDLVETSRSMEFLEAHRVSLTMISGPTAGTEYPLEGARTIAGRSGKAEIQLDDGSVSSEHAAFELDATGFGVRDLASTNGVLVNGKPVLSTALEHGDRIRLGECELQYVVEDRSREPAVWSLKEGA